MSKLFIPIELVQSSSDGVVGACWEKGIPVTKLDWFPAKMAVDYYRENYPMIDVYVVASQHHYPAPPEIASYVLFVPPTGLPMEIKGISILKWTLQLAMRFNAPFVFNGNLIDIVSKLLQQGLYLSPDIRIWWENNPEYQIQCRITKDKYFSYRDPPNNSL